jgi:hypothetical protein
MSAITYFALGAIVMLALAILRERFTGFGAQRSQDYAQSEPCFDLRQHLDGKIKCEGVIYGPLGRVASRFTGDFVADWEGSKGIMREHFEYDSGNSQDREWRLELGNDGSIRAEADDLVGLGQGQQSGASVCLHYRIRLPDEAGGHVLRVTDWMYLAPNGVVVNRSQFRKFGIKVAELVATMRKVEAA